MNLLASFDWLKEYVDLKETPEQLAARVSLSGPGVERLYPQGVELEKIIVGKVLEVGPHPNADKLRIAIVQVSKQQTAHIVCGGSNLAVGQWVAVAQVGASVRWHGEGDPIVLQPAEIRGVKSEGMICAANEIGLFDAFPHGEKEILDVGEALAGQSLVPGMPLAQALGLVGDVVMDIEVTSNRPDAFGMVGLARECATILNRPFTWKPSSLPKGGKQTLSVQVEDKALCPRYMAVRVEGVTVGHSPWWLKRRLLSAGIRPINTVVDITNYVMLEIGQPMHAFDASTLSGGELHVRRARLQETLEALDGKRYSLTDSMLVIADAEKPVAVAGVMGGEHTGVTSATTSIVFEAAAFDDVSVRRTARALNLYSDAQLRFEKGLSTEFLPVALARAVELCLTLCGGTVATKVADVRAKAYKPRTYKIPVARVQEIVGVDIPEKEMVAILKRLGFEVRLTGKAVKKQLVATVPYWRDHDIEDGRDLVEEIARVYGYGAIPGVLPVGQPTRPTDPELQWEERMRALAKGAGFTETYTYSFISRELAKKAGFNPQKMLPLANPLSAEFEVMRTSLVPSLLQVVQENQERFRAMRLFEVAHVYVPSSETEGWRALPNEVLTCSLAILGGDSAWREAKGFVEHLFADWGIQQVRWVPVTEEALWHPGRTVQAFQGEHLLATIGEIHPEIAARFKIEGRLACADLALEEIFAHATTTKRYVPLPVFPEAKRDLAFLVDRDAACAALAATMQEASTLLTQVEWFDTFMGKGVPEGKKSVAFHLTFATPDRTLASSEVDVAIAQITERLGKRFGAEVRG